MLRRFGSTIRDQWIGTLALLIALTGGTAYAANTVFTGDIVDGQVKTVDLANGAVTVAKIADGGITGDKVKDGALQGRDVLDDSLKGADIDESSLQGLGGGGSAGVRAWAQVQPSGGPLGSPCTNGPDGDRCKIYRSKGITKVTNPETGYYCVFAPGLSPLSAPAGNPAPVLTLDSSSSGVGMSTASAYLHLSDAEQCASQLGAFGVLTTSATNSSNQVGFTILIP